MEKSRVAQRQQQFAEQLEQLESELQALEAACATAASASSAPPPWPTSIVSPDSADADGASPIKRASLERLQQQIVRLVYRIAALCGQHQDYKLAAQYYRRVLEWLDAREHARCAASSPSHPPSLSLSPAPAPTPQLERTLTRTQSSEFSESRRGVKDAVIDADIGSSAATATAATTRTSYALVSPAPPPLTDSDVWLRENVLNNLAAMHFGAGERAQAMSCLLDVKKLIRDRAHIHEAPMLSSGHEADDGTSAKAVVKADASRDISNRTVDAAVELRADSARDDALLSRDFERMLAVNYALLLYAKGSLDDAIHAASSVIEEPAAERRSNGGDSERSSSMDGVRAKVVALSLLASCWKEKGEDDQAMEFASQAAQLAGYTQYPVLLARTHSNLALHCFERRDFAIALNHLLTAYRATQVAQDLQQQAVVTYHIGLVIAELEVGVELPQSGRTESLHRATAAAGLSMAAAAASRDSGWDTSVERKQVPRSTSKRADLAAMAAAIPTVVATLMPTPLASAKDCFVQSENLASALPTQDPGLYLLAHACRGESEYYAGEFHTAEAEFSIALQQLRELLLLTSPDDSDAPQLRYSAAPGPAAVVSAGPASVPSIAELVKIQGHLLSFLGCTQLVEGKFELAEEAHQSDLDLALKYEDIHAQQRAMRNLALVYSSTQRYHEAIPLWREALEIASVLESKSDQMMAYSGLGMAVKELRITDQRCAFAELLNLKENDPLQIFQRQRALAIELGDRHQHIIAQRNIVSAYESPERVDIEQRLTECDALARLCEQYEDIQYRADAYRALANALTAQIARLGARGARFAEAVAVLSQKRDSVCAKYQQTARTLKTVAAAMLRTDESEARMFALKKAPQSDERHARARVTRVEVIQRQ